MGKLAAYQRKLCAELKTYHVTSYWKDLGDHLDVNSELMADISRKEDPTDMLLYKWLFGLHHFMDEDYTTRCIDPLCDAIRDTSNPDTANNIREQLVAALKEDIAAETRVT